MKKLVRKIAEEGEGGGTPTNNAGSGNIAGIGVGPQGEPGISPRVQASHRNRIRRRSPPVGLAEGTFAGKKVFVVNGDYFNMARLGKKKHDKYEKYVGRDEIGEAIRMYGRDPKNKGKAIILQHENTGAMMYLKYGSS